MVTKTRLRCPMPKNIKLSGSPFSAENFPNDHLYDIEGPKNAEKGHLYLFQSD